MIRPLDSLTAGRPLSELQAPLRLFLETAAWMQGAPAETAAAGSELAHPCSDVSVARLLAEIDATPAPARDEAAAARGAGRCLEELLELPPPARDLALEALGRRGWGFLGFGMRRLPLLEEEGLRLDLVRIEPGFGPPLHDHKGEELTLVLSGAFCDHTGGYGPGAVSVQADGSTHRPLAEGDQACIALVLTAGPPQFHGALGLLQRTLRLN